MDPDAFQEGWELLEESLEGVSRVAEIVKNVREFAYAGQGERETADINDLLAATLRIAQPKLRNRANVESDFGRIPLILSRVQELKQVFLNLLLNASQAIEDGGNIRISTEFVDPDIVVSVEDDGCGMTPDLLERIFDPFFSTKKVGEGMGLGLSLSYQMVKNHGGDIRVESEPGRGTLLLDLLSHPRNARLLSIGRRRRRVGESRLSSGAPRGSGTGPAPPDWRGRRGS